MSYVDEIYILEILMKNYSKYSSPSQIGGKFLKVDTPKAVVLSLNFDRKLHRQAVSIYNTKPFQSLVADINLYFAATKDPYSIGFSLDTYSTVLQT